jgi:hypothetical protein
MVHRVLDGCPRRLEGDVLAVKVGDRGDVEPVRRRTAECRTW